MQLVCATAVFGDEEEDRQLSRAAITLRLHPLSQPGWGGNQAINVKKCPSIKEPLSEIKARVLCVSHQLVQSDREIA